jgi:hypothetical protein
MFHASQLVVTRLRPENAFHRYVLTHGPSMALSKSPRVISKN